MRAIQQTGTKRTVRDISLKGVRSDKSPAVAAKRAEPWKDPTVCNLCGALYTRKRWRKPERMTFVRLGTVDWATCPACQQVKASEYFGRVLLEGDGVGERLAEIQRRVANVARRAEHTQPERRLVSVEKTPTGVEVLATSQKLAHRIAAELRKLLGGRVTYHWSDRDGALFARWRPGGKAE